MSRIYQRTDSSGRKEHMVGLNAKTEPEAFIRGAFEVFEKIIQSGQKSALYSSVIIDTMFRGIDLSKSNAEYFLEEYQRIVGRTLKKAYADSETEIVLGKGGRLTPPAGKNWTSEEWTELNLQRLHFWASLIWDQMKVRGWSVDFMHHEFSLDLSEMPNVPEKLKYKPDLNETLTKQIEGLFQRMDRLEAQLRESRDLNRRIYDLLKSAVDTNDERKQA